MRIGIFVCSTVATFFAFLDPLKILRRTLTVSFLERNSGIHSGVQEQELAGQWPFRAGLHSLYILSKGLVS